MYYIKGSSLNIAFSSNFLTFNEFFDQQI